MKRWNSEDPVCCSPGRTVVEVVESAPIHWATGKAEIMTCGDWPNDFQWFSFVRQPGKSTFHEQLLVSSMNIFKRHQRDFNLIWHDSIMLTSNSIKFNSSNTFQLQLLQQKWKHHEHWAVIALLLDRKAHSRTFITVDALPKISLSSSAWEAKKTLINWPYGKLVRHCPTESINLPPFTIRTQTQKPPQNMAVGKNIFFRKLYYGRCSKEFSAKSIQPRYVPRQKLKGGAVVPSHWRHRQARVLQDVLLPIGTATEDTLRIFASKNSLVLPLEEWIFVETLHKPFSWLGSCLWTWLLSLKAPHFSIEWSRDPNQRTS